jgi:THO complex subunit 2
MSTYDVAPPITKYEEETANLRALSRQEDSKYVSADRSSDRIKRQSAMQHRSRRDRYNMFANLLAQESKDQIITMGYTKKRLAKEKQHWFAHSKQHLGLFDYFMLML